jgi:hypothetical protein
MSKTYMVGASSSGLVTTLAACGVSSESALLHAHEIAEQHSLSNRRLGLFGIWGGLVRQWLDDLLPPDAHERCSGRVHLLLNEFTPKGLRHVYVDRYDNARTLVPLFPP